MSLLEIFLGLVVVSFILMLTVKYFNVTDGDLKLARAVSQIKNLSKASYQWLSMQRQADFGSGATGVSLSKLEAAGLANPQEEKNPWGGEIVLTPGLNDASYVRMTMEQVPVKACESLRQRMKGIAHQQSIADECVTKTYFIEM